MTLTEAKVGDKLIIETVKEGQAHRRLLDFGFTAGAVISVCNVAPFGGTVLVSVRGYVVALRSAACDLIVVRPAEARHA